MYAGHFRVKSLYRSWIPLVSRKACVRDETSGPSYSNSTSIVRVTARGLENPARCPRFLAAVVSRSSEGLLYPWFFPAHIFFFFPFHLDDAHVYVFSAYSVASQNRALTPNRVTLYTVYARLSRSVFILFYFIFL